MKRFGSLRRSKKRKEQDGLGGKHELSCLAGNMSCFLTKRASNVLSPNTVCTSCCLLWLQVARVVRECGESLVSQMCAVHFLHQGAKALCYTRAVTVNSNGLLWLWRGFFRGSLEGLIKGHIWIIEVWMVYPHCIWGKKNSQRQWRTMVWATGF